MVRSKGEPGRDFLYLMEQIKLEDKYFNYSRLEVANKIGSDGVAELECEHSTSSENGLIDVPLKLFIKTHRKRWAAALLLNQIRIDGIDWLPRFPCKDGSTGTGWHRHSWEPDEANPSVHIPLPVAFGVGVTNVEEFLIRVSQEMRIVWSANDVGFNDRLPLS